MPRVGHQCEAVNRDVLQLLCALRTLLLQSILLRGSKEEGQECAGDSRISAAQVKGAINAHAFIINRLQAIL